MSSEPLGAYAGYPGVLYFMTTSDSISVGTRVLVNANTGSESEEYADTSGSAYSCFWTFSKCSDLQGAGRRIVESHLLPEVALDLGLS